MTTALFVFYGAQPSIMSDASGRHKVAGIWRAQIKKRTATPSLEFSFVHATKIAFITTDADGMNFGEHVVSLTLA